MFYGVFLPDLVMKWVWHELLQIISMIEYCSSFLTAPLNSVTWSHSMVEEQVVDDVTVTILLVPETVQDYDLGHNILEL